MQPRYWTPYHGRMTAISRVGLVAVVLLIGFCLWALTTRPKADRQWITQQARSPIVHVEGHTARIENVRDFQYRSWTDFTPQYRTQTVDLDRLNSVSLVLSPFGERWRGPAHSFLTFGFSDSTYLSISVEARREQGETFGALKGMLRRFELLYVIGTERDLIGSRAAYGPSPVYLYPIKAPPERMRAVLVAMLARADSLRTHPEFYNTLTNNCTSNVVRHVNQVAPHEIPGGWKTVLPGYMDEVAMGLGLLDTSLPIEAARARYRINDRGRRFVNAPDFSERIRVP
jgi:hypothetical protein